MKNELRMARPGRATHVNKTLCKDKAWTKWAVYKLCGILDAQVGTTDAALAAWMFQASGSAPSAAWQVSNTADTTTPPILLQGAIFGDILAPQDY